MVKRVLTITTNYEDIIQVFESDNEIVITKRHPDSESVHSFIYLEKKEAKALGEELIKLSDELA